ncbi:hypothetical protein GF326_06535 [Candidatus Bathyarchaeota archaeon]|nr:hypothetical protein [Candidatus Bathyarchaeota archaeon]
MKLSLKNHTPDIETMIATSMLTTTSGAMPSTLYRRLLENQDKVEGIVGRVEVQHGNILEHNRLVWRMDAEGDEVLSILLNSKFFNITPVDDHWIISSNMRALVEYHQTIADEFSEQLVESIKEVSPRIYSFIRRKTG